MVFHGMVFGGVGLARADDEELLAAANADLVVTSLDEVDVAGASIS
ncbi:MAG TPA: hypothetical protein VGO16_08460 [Pseudonocardiaceae bacterium]|jgi:hypothetical protein|nr:hypothetical protein [Pseudonocardiaceae bacterium]